MDATVLKRESDAVPSRRKTVHVDHSRHLQMFDPSVFDRTRVDVIGCGSVGSRIGLELAKLGVRNLHLWDDDIVEAHNLANQLYILDDVDRERYSEGRRKVEALAEHICKATGIEVIQHPIRIESPVELGDVVFLAVDTMGARKNIFEQSLRLKPYVRQVIETRMGVEELRVYGFNPCSRAEIKAWTDTLYDDKTTVENACQARTTVGATAGITACLAVTRFLQWYRWGFVRDPKFTQPHAEQLVMLRPLTTIANGV